MSVHWLQNITGLLFDCTMEKSEVRRLGCNDHYSDASPPRFTRVIIAPQLGRLTP